jgi:hypothetical protein
MIQDEIIEMAKKVGGLTVLNYVELTYKELEAFAALVAAKEREACAKWLEDKVDAPNWAKQIRARGQE